MPGWNHEHVLTIVAFGEVAPTITRQEPLIRTAPYPAVGGVHPTRNRIGRERALDPSGRQDLPPVDRTAVQEQEPQTRLVARGGVETAKELLDPARFTVERPRRWLLGADWSPECAFEIVRDRFATEASMQDIPQQLDVHAAVQIVATGAPLDVVGVQLIAEIGAVIELRTG